MAIGFKGSDQEKQLREIQKKFKELYNQKSGAKATEGASHSLANNGKGDYNNYKTHNLFTRVIRKFHDTKRNEFFVNDFENYYKVRPEEYGSYEVHDVIKISGNEERIMQHEKELSNETNTNGKSTNRNNEVFRYIEGHNHWNNAETTGQSWTEFIDEVLKKYESEGTDGYGSYEQGLGNSRGNRYSLSDKTSSTDGVFFDAQKDGVMYSLSEDSKGKQLSEGQKKFFKDSKTLDTNGNLKVMYHGSPAQFTVFDKKKAKSSGYYGRRFYFSESESHAGQYGSMYEVYLNIKNPMQEGTNDITKEQLRKFVSAVAENEDYGIENYGYDATVDSVTNSVYGKDDFAMIMDKNATSIGDMVEAMDKTRNLPVALLNNTDTIRTTELVFGREKV